MWVFNCLGRPGGFWQYWFFFNKAKVHSPSKCLVLVACLWSKMPMLQRAEMKEGGLPLPPAFQYLIILIWRACDLNLVMISSPTSKCQDFKLKDRICTLFFCHSHSHSHSHSALCRVVQIMYCPLKLKNWWQAQNFLII